MPLFSTWSVSHTVAPGLYEPKSSGFGNAANNATMPVPDSGMEIDGVPKASLAMSSEPE